MPSLSLMARTLAHTHTHLHATFQPPRVKPVATREGGIFVDRPTNQPAQRPTELLVAAKKIFSNESFDRLLYSNLATSMINRELSTNSATSTDEIDSAQQPK